MMRTAILSLLTLGLVGLGKTEDQGLLLKIEVTQAVSCGAPSKNGDTLAVNYNGTFTNGTLFDSSKRHALTTGVVVDTRLEPTLTF